MHYGYSSWTDSAEPIHDSLRIMAHDVRAPLQTIGMAAELLRVQAGSAPDVQRALKIIHAAIRQIDVIVDDVLNSSRQTEEGEDESSLHAVEAGAVLAEAGEQHGDMAELRNVSITVERPTDPVYAAIGREPLLRVLANLLSNALRHTPAGGRVRLATQQLGQHVAFLVADTGQGMDAGALEELLRSSAAHDALAQPAGHGLAIVQSLVRAAGGQVSAVSRPGSGTTFTIFIPASAPSARHLHGLRYRVHGSAVSGR
jgi:signal transduction histidine kinase